MIVGSPVTCNDSGLKAIANVRTGIRSSFISYFKLEDSELKSYNLGNLYGIQFVVSRETFAHKELLFPAFTHYNVMQLFWLQKSSVRHYLSGTSIFIRPL